MERIDFMIDEHGRLHKPPGSSEGGQYTTKESAQASKEHAPKQPTERSAQADGIVQKYKDKLREAIDKVPGGSWLRSRAEALNEKLKARYGENAAKKIVASAVAISWGAFFAGPLVGYPNYIPVSVAMLPAVAIAELHYRLTGKGKTTVDDDKKDYAEQGADLSNEEIERLARELIDDLTVSYAHDSSIDLSDLIQRLQWAKLGKNPGDQKATKRLSDEITRRTDLKHLIDHQGRMIGYMVDRLGNEHKPAGTPEGGQFANKVSGGSAQGRLGTKAFRDTQSFADAIGAAINNEASAKAVAQRLTPGAIGHLSRRVKKIHACANLAEVGKQYEALTSDTLEKDDVVAGLWNASNGTLIMDGPAPSIDMTTEDILAHELGHALDTKGKYYVHSTSDEFQKAFDAEIKDGQLSDYAATDEQEGFAEFARLLYGSDVPRDELAKTFPLTLAYFQQLGFA